MPCWCSIRYDIHQRPIRSGEYPQAIAHRHQMPIFQPEREKQLMTDLCASRQYQKACESFLKELMDLSKALQKEEMEK